MINIEQIKKKIEEKLKSLNYRLNSINYQKENQDYYLRIEIDNDDSISMDDIVLVSDNLSSLLDDLDLIKEPYILDISSSGIEKEIPFDKLKDNINAYIGVYLKNSIKDNDYFEGTLVEVNDSSILIKYFLKGAPKKQIIELENINQIKFAIKI